MVSSSLLKQFQRATQALLGLVAINVIFFIFAPTYRAISNFQTIFSQATVLGVMAVGTTVVLLSAGLDLSVGSILTFVAVSVGSMLNLQYPVWLIVFIALGIGAFWGTVNGLIIVITGVSPLIVTLGMMMVLRGFSELLGAGKDMSSFPRAFRALGSGYFIPVLIMAAAYLVVAFILGKTRLGFNTYAIGGNQEVARLSGIRVNKCKVIYYAIGGLMAGLAAVLLTARLNFANSTFGQGMEMNSIAAVVIGGTSMSGGIGGVGRTIIGVLIMTCLASGLSHMGVGSSWQRVSIGIVIILAVWIDTAQRKRTL
ncbi:ABC transporter permease [Atribacter laminatus]|jgi:ribose/xylose/arabinose/galactoside ABC-type transport system permease subunit|uniref:Ribose import permease protein RbsC n=1 Tax=Atribacter laminatus TaxID=2847778 RepID=A0A7T1AMN0_ATRLM|nr:ABC transporter permease [Atribacter laminatus]QPM68713.1 Ribose import permease protein RbsC [Atribacter laminatus]